ncbi:lysozyme inhibitor LprI family protein [Teredinibacter haidensis]|uniref:lysozyme inhibitor LprI family protein n=1 Tax=Teredinibacter haidensis TaxID=2731755 RepID=UPI000948B431|nr:lysozyme inhibitor LprI family protein [Teredinibacter haidensis]
MIRIILLLTAFLSNASLAASFDCSKADRELDKTICLNKNLSKLDEDMSSYYFKLKETLNEKKSDKFLKNQRVWLKQRAVECGFNDATCLVELYKTRILELRKEHENLIPYTYSKKSMFQGVKGACSFDTEVIFDDTKIYAGGSYSGKKINFQIDQSGHQATQFEVIVNSPNNPVALILGAYEPSVWNIAWTQGTKISAVVATGYHRQAVAGLPQDTPILISSYDNRGPCGYVYVAEKNLRKINPLSRKVFNKDVTLVHYASKGSLVFGDQINHNDKLFTSKDTPPELFFDKTVPLAGQAGLEDFVRKGLIRKATVQDSERWAQMKAEMHKDELPPVASGSISSTFRPRSIHNGYVILKEITIPSGLYGGNSATFFLNKGVPFPKGKLGHSTLYNFNTKSCSGTGCRR